MGQKSSRNWKLMSSLSSSKAWIIGSDFLGSILGPNFGPISYSIWRLVSTKEMNWLGLNIPFMAAEERLNCILSYLLRRYFEATVWYRYWKASTFSYTCWWAFTNLLAKYESCHQSLLNTIYVYFKSLFFWQGQPWTTQISYMFKAIIKFTQLCWEQRSFFISQGFSQPELDPWWHPRSPQWTTEKWTISSCFLAQKTTIPKKNQVTTVTTDNMVTTVTQFWATALLNCSFPKKSRAPGRRGAAFPVDQGSARRAIPADFTGEFPPGSLFQGHSLCWSIGKWKNLHLCFNSL